MNCEAAQKLLETLVGREVVIICKPSAGGGMAGFNAAGTLKKSAVEGMWEVYRVGLDPTEPPQQAKARSLAHIVSSEDVGCVIALGDVSAISPAGIFRPTPGGEAPGGRFR